MQNLILEARKLIHQEYKERKADHGPFVDAHQAYSVILEERDETVEEVSRLADHIEELWQNVKNDDIGLDAARKIMYRSELVAAEVIQCGAMARKLIDLYTDGKE